MAKGVGIFQLLEDIGVSLKVLELDRWKMKTSEPQSLDVSVHGMRNGSA